MSRVNFPNGRARYKCDHCGVIECWGLSWVWFGSYFDYDAGDEMHFCCREHGDEHERAMPALFAPKKRTRRKS
jgi:hypothetical protein